MEDKRSTEEMLMDMTLEKIHKEAEKAKRKIFMELKDFVKDHIIESNYDPELFSEKLNMEIINLMSSRWLKANELSTMAVYKHFGDIPTTLEEKIIHYTW